MSKLLSNLSRRGFIKTGAATVASLALTPDIMHAAVFNHETASNKKRIILEKNMTKAGNVLTQAMINRTNSIYVIRHDFVLVADMIIPEGCILQFDGGSISGAFSIVGNHTAIDAGVVKVFGLNVSLTGSWFAREVYPEWFGAKGDGVTDDSDYIEKAISFSTQDKSIFVVLSRVYYVSKTIRVYKSLNLKGYHVSDRPLHNLRSIKPSSESCIIIAKNTTAFNVIGIPKENTTRFTTLNIYGIKIIGTSNTFTENFISINAFGYPSRPSNIKDCEFAGLNKIIDFNISNHYDAQGYSIGILNVENINCYLSNHFIYSKDEKGNHPSLCNLHLKDSVLEHMKNIALYIYDLFGPNIIENCLFEDGVTPIDIRIMEGATLSVKSNYFTHVTGDCMKISGQERPHDFGKSYVSVFDNCLVSTLTAHFQKVHIINGQDLNKFTSCTLSYCALDSKYANLPLEWVTDFVLVTGNQNKPSIKPLMITDRAAFKIQKNGYLGEICNKNTTSHSLSTTYNVSTNNYLSFFKDDKYITYWVTNNHGDGQVYNLHSALPGIVITKINIRKNDGYISYRIRSYNNSEESIYASQASVFLNLVSSTISAASASRIGDAFYEETLKKPIYWSGINWTDASGSSI